MGRKRRDHPCEKGRNARLSPVATRPRYSVYPAISRNGNHCGKHASRKITPEQPGDHASPFCTEFAGVYRSGMIGNADAAAMQVWMPRWFPDQSFAHGAIEPLLG